jgi:hypothetical protein
LGCGGSRDSAGQQRLKLERHKQRQGSSGLVAVLLGSGGASQIGTLGSGGAGLGPAGIFFGTHNLKIPASKYRISLQSWQRLLYLKIKPGILHDQQIKAQLRHHDRRMPSFVSRRRIKLVLELLPGGHHL